MRKILIVGATSAVATATTRLLGSQGHALFLAARNETALYDLAEDLRTRGVQQVHTGAFSADATDRFAALLDSASRALGGLDTAIIAYGTLPQQLAIQDSPLLVAEAIASNFTSVAALLSVLGARFEREGRGTIVAISSVAGDRGRAANYVYGSAKAGLTCFLSGMRQRLGRKSVQVITIKSGLIDTPMTADFPKGLLWSDAETVAKGIVRALEARGTTVYVPGYWRIIMWIVRIMPERIFSRMKF